jgi:hypothetical protein
VLRGVHLPKRLDGIGVIVLPLLRLTRSANLGDIFSPVRNIAFLFLRVMQWERDRGFRRELDWELSATECHRSSRRSDLPPRNEIYANTEGKIDLCDT